jgi:hypothetical protein
MRSGLNPRRWVFCEQAEQPAFPGRDPRYPFQSVWIGEQQIPHLTLEKGNLYGKAQPSIRR